MTMAQSTMCMRNAAALRGSLSHFAPALYEAQVLRDARGTMFVVELTYTAPLADIDASMAAHVKFLHKHYASGHFLVSGRKIPRDGGIILAVAKDREQIEAIVRQDPFCSRGLAEFRIIEFRASQQADDIQRRMSATFS